MGLGRDVKGCMEFRVMVSSWGRDSVTNRF